MDRFSFPATAFPERDLPQGGGGEDDEEARDIDYYIFLNVKPDCSDDDLKIAYRRLALIWHPDRHTDPEARAHATAKFARLTHIHDTLTTPGKRRLYDLYGEKGLSSGLEVGTHLPTSEQIREAYKKHQGVAKQERELARLGLAGVLQASVSLIQWAPLRKLLGVPDSNVVHYRGDEEGTGGAQLKSSMLAERFSTHLSRKDHLEVSGQMLHQSNGQGMGLLAVIIKRTFSARSWAKVKLHLGLDDSPLSLSTFRALSASTMAKIHVRLSAAGSQLKCACSRRLTPDSLAKLQYIMGGAEAGVKVRAVRQSESGTVRGEAWLGFGAFSLSGAIARRLSKRSGLSASASFSQNGPTMEVGVRRRISQRSSFAAACALSLVKGITLKFSLARMNQELSIPLQLSRHLSIRSILIGAVLPALCGALLKSMWLGPRQRRRKERKRLRLRSEHAESVAHARQEAKGDVELMHAAVARKRTAETARNGLLIIRGVFGRIPPREGDDPHWPLNASSPGAGSRDAGDVVDVTVPLQYLLEDSKLQLFNSSKSGLPGFFDPVPGEAKTLYVLYRFRGRLHEVTVSDEEPVCIPLQRDALPASTPRYLDGVQVPHQTTAPRRADAS